MPPTTIPYGMRMPGRLFSPDEYRFGYQGQFAEHDEETGYNAFEARLWDSRIGRWMSPDPAGQFWSPYLGMGNSPVNGVDPDGEFVIVDDFIIGGFKGLFNDEGFWQSGCRHAINSAKIWGGLFASDRNLSISRRAWQIISRFTWELPQTTLGFIFAHSTNMMGDVSLVDYYGGATAVRDESLMTGGLALGSFITGDDRLTASPYNSLFQHEYGHYLQSRSISGGLFWVFKYGLPSIINAINHPFTHDSHWSEQDANLRSKKYWNQNLYGMGSWRENSNPILKDSYIVNMPLLDLLKKRIK
jgi:RHS repeat-associated protein